MYLHFDCRVCGARHPSRLRVANPQLLQTVMHAFGEVLEPCAVTGRWIAVRFDDLRWDTPASQAIVDRSPPYLPNPA
jgi:hypothetical protein